MWDFFDSNLFQTLILILTVSSTIIIFRLTLYNEKLKAFVLIKNQTAEIYESSREFFEKINTRNNTSPDPNAVVNFPKILRVNYFDIYQSVYFKHLKTNEFKALQEFYTIAEQINEHQDRYLLMYYNAYNNLISNLSQKMVFGEQISQDIRLQVCLPNLFFELMSYNLEKLKQAYKLLPDSVKGTQRES